MDELIKLDQVDEITLNIEPADEIDLDLGEVLGVVRPPELEKVEVTPTKETQVIKPSKFGTYIEETKVYPIPDEYADISNVDATAEDVLNGKTFVDNQGNEVQGTAELKEDLDAELTAQDEAITRLTIAVDTLPDEKGAKEIVIDLPSEFSNVSSFYYFQFDEDTLLISGYPGIFGVWKYKISTKTSNRLYNRGYSWQYFQKIGDVCLIANTFSDGILLYNSLDSTITQIYSLGAYWSIFKVIDDKCFISSQNSQGKGLLVYNIADRTIEQIYTEGNSWKHIIKIDNKYFISSSDSRATGMLLYNDIEVIKIFDEGYNWSMWHQFKDKYFIAGGTGLLIFDGVNISRMFDSGSWTSLINIEDKCLISGSSGDTGIYIYDGVSTVQSYTLGSSWKYYQKVGDKYLIGGGWTSSGTGILLYDPAIISFQRLYSSGNYWQFFHMVGDSCLISSSYSSGVSGVLLYNSSSKTIVSKFGAGYYYNKFTQDVGNSGYLESDNKNNNKLKLYYDDNAKTVKAVGYYI